MINNPFLSALIFKYVYYCKGEEIELTTEDTSDEHGRYFVVVCDKCCNIPVFHLLERK